jgi:hypothetical protein
MKFKWELKNHLLAAVVILFMLASKNSASAQTWSDITPAGGPSSTVISHQPAGIGYDAVSNRLVLYFPSNPAVTGSSTEVWVLTNANGLGGPSGWIHLAPSGSPPFSNALDAVVYDAATNRLIVYGGCFANCSPALSNVFVLTNANGLGGSPAWSQSIVTNPQPRTHHPAVLDSANNLLISFGGHFAFFGTDQNDTRVLSNANGAVSPSTWSSLSIAGPPPIRNQHTAVYDQANNRMTIFAGTNYLCCNFQIDKNDVWVLTNANGMTGTPMWIPQSPLGSLPAPRFGHSAVYDSVNNRMLVFGGRDDGSNLTLGDLWQLSNANGLGGTPAWTQLTQSGDLPGPRFYHAAAFDSANQRMILFGGRNDNNVPITSDRVWVLAFNTAPTAICQNVTVSAGPSCTANASIDNGSFDPDGGDTITLSQSPAGPYPLGTTSVTLTVTDNHGASNQCTANVTVVDDTPPAITGTSASPSSLGPPNHKMMNVTVNYSVSDNCDASPACVLSVASNEPLDGTGDGDTSPDWEVIDAHQVRLRAERAGGGTGRVYTITITCTDAANNSSSKTVTVTVPDNQ